MLFPSSCGFIYVLERNGNLPMAENSKKKIEIKNLSVFFADKEVLNGISFDIYDKEIIGVLGPAKSGKTTLLKVINRTIELLPGAKVEGRVKIDNIDIKNIKNVNQLRRKIGMVFPLPVGLPLSIYDNVALAPRATGNRNKGNLDEIVERCLKQAVLWDEVKDRLDLLGTRLSGGQQQRLTLARALSLSPEILCLDEYSIAIDPLTTMKIEDIL